jgi:magnesium chelatase family protein
MTPRDVRRHCRLQLPAEGLLGHVTAKLGLSARAYTRVLKLARTIADLAGAPEIDPVYVSEAYGVLDRVRVPARAG